MPGPSDHELRRYRHDSDEDLASRLEFMAHRAEYDELVSRDSSMDATSIGRRHYLPPRPDCISNPSAINYFPYPSDPSGSCTTEEYTLGGREDDERKSRMSAVDVHIPPARAEAVCCEEPSEDSLEKETEKQESGLVRRSQEKAGLVGKTSPEEAGLDKRSSQEETELIEESSQEEDGTVTRSSQEEVGLMGRGLPLEAEAVGRSSLEKEGLMGKNAEEESS